MPRPTAAWQQEGTMVMNRTSGDAGPAVGDALSRAVEAGHRLLTDRIDLLELEMKQTLRSVAHAASLAGMGLVLAVVGWVVVSAGLAVLLMETMPLWLGCLLVGLVQLIAGAVLVASSRREAHTPKLGFDPTERARVRTGPRGRQT